MSRLESFAGVALAFAIGVALPAVLVYGPSLLTR